jgi:hypothetical protein
VDSERFLNRSANVSSPQTPTGEDSSGTGKTVSTNKTFANLLMITEKQEDEEASDMDEGNINLEDIEIEQTLKKQVEHIK